LDSSSSSSSSFVLDAPAFSAAKRARLTAVILFRYSDHETSGFPEQFNGWQQLHDSYINGYPNQSAMGFIEPASVQVKLLKPDLAIALTWWAFNFPGSRQKVVGNTTMNLQKFDEGWKIVASHSSTAKI
jgi:hypothetical protein